MANTRTICTSHNQQHKWLEQQPGSKLQYLVHACYLLHHFSLPGYTLGCNSKAKLSMCLAIHGIMGVYNMHVSVKWHIFNTSIVWHVLQCNHCIAIKLLDVYSTYLCIMGYSIGSHEFPTCSYISSTPVQYDQLNPGTSYMYYHPLNGLCRAEQTSLCCIRFRKQHCKSQMILLPLSPFFELFI